MKKVIIEARLLSRNTGISGFFLKYLDELIKIYTNTEFLLVTDNANGLEKYKINKNLKIIEISTQKYIYHPFISDLYYGLVALPKFLKKQSADLLISPYYDFIIPANFISKTIITIHDLCYNSCKNIYYPHTKIVSKYFLKQALNKCSGVVTVSKTSMKSLYLYYKNYLNKTNIGIFYNCFDENNNFCELYQLNNKRKKNQKKIIYTGGFERRKNIDILFQAFSIIVRENVDVYLVITGNLDKNKKLLKKIKNYDIKNNVILTGLLSNDQLQNLYVNDIDGAINISFCEGFGRNNYEAKMYGIPLLCSNIAINHEIVGDYPIYCDPTKINDIINGIKKLLIMPLNKPEQFIDERFKLEKNVPRFISFIDDCMK